MSEFDNRMLVVLEVESEQLRRLIDDGEAVVIYDHQGAPLGLLRSAGRDAWDRENPDG